MSAPRRTVKPPHRTASATGTDVAAPATSNDATAPAGSSSTASPRRSDAPVRPARARHSNDTARSARRTNASSRDGAEAKAPSGLAAGASGSAEAKAPSGLAAGASGATDVTKVTSESARSATDVSGKKSDTHSSAAKPPADTAVKSTAEKFAPEASIRSAIDGETPDPSRSPVDTETPSVRRDGSSLDGRRENAPPPLSPASSTGAPSARPVVISLEAPLFDGGDVPRAAAALERMKGALGRCVASENALTKNEASIELRFLVRAPGRAEGVGAEKARGVSADVVRCMTSVLARSYIGAPSDDPVGVALTVRVRRPEPANN